MSTITVTLRFETPIRVVGRYLVSRKGAVGVVFLFLALYRLWRLAARIPLSNRNIALLQLLVAFATLILGVAVFLSR